MQLNGKNMIGSSLSAEGTQTIAGVSPHTGETLSPPFFEATTAEVNRAAVLAAEAAGAFSACSADQVAGLLERIAEAITALGDSLIEHAAQESGLSKDRLTGERARTLNQIRLFAEMVRDGSWVNAAIDTAMPERVPLPRPDIRRMLIPLGPVAVFGASNFPLAFSVAGGDTISALAAGNPVIVKAHPAHPGTSELVARAIARAIQSSAMPSGIFSLVQGASPRVSIDLVTHPQIKAVGFTGSQAAGRALFDAAARRPEPIPVYAEMGSVNPLFVLPGALAKSPEALAKDIFNSVNLGVGQFCTKPGLVIGMDGPQFERLRELLASMFTNAPPGTMLYAGIHNAFEKRLGTASNVSGVTAHASAQTRRIERTEAAPAMLATDAGTWLHNEALQGEIFGPATVSVACGSHKELLRVAEQIQGSLTATIHGTPGDLEKYSDLVAVLRAKAGRLIFNGYPTGVEVSHAMHHGGPYPATTDSKFTSVGATAIHRFARPICYQDFPEAILPPELQNANPRKIWRTVNGRWTRDGL
jgi:alpha-ketoglutaric semialdehyde dehydrogenase